MNGYVLTNFLPHYLTDSIPQEESVQLAIEMRTRAIALKEGITQQDDINALHKSIYEKMMHFGLRPEHIAKRRLYFAINPERILNASFNKEDSFLPCQKFLYEDLLLHKKQPRGAPISERMDVFDTVVTKAVADMYVTETKQPDDMIHVTCTGYVSSSPVQRLVNAKKWNNTTVTHSYHMGCYGSIPGMRMALGFLTSSEIMRQKPKEQIDIVHTEFNSLHSNLLDDSPGAIIASTLFGDGFIRYSLVRESTMKKNQVGLKVLTLDETLLPHTLEGMSWKINDYHFRINLGVTIPDDIQANIMTFVEKLFKNLGLDFHTINREDFIFAIHPGGPKITHNIAQVLNLSKDEVRYSTEVLLNNGNMASATIPFILKNIIDDEAIPVGKKIITMAFGPGLTAAGGIFEKVVG